MDRDKWITGTGHVELLRNDSRELDCRQRVAPPRLKEIARAFNSKAPPQVCSEGVGFAPRGRLRKASPTSPMSLLWLARPGPSLLPLRG